MGTMKVNVYADLEDLPPSYRPLFESASCDSFFLSETWFKILIDTTLEPGACVRMYGVEEDQHATPLALFVARTPAGQNGSRFHPRWLGPTTLASMTNYQTVLYNLLLSPQVTNPSFVLRPLFETIYKESPTWTLLDVNGLLYGTPLYEKWIEHLKEMKMKVFPYFYTGNWYEPVRGQSYETYLKGRPTTKKREKRLSKKGLVRFVMVQEEDQLPSAIKDYQRVHEASWKQSEPFPSFTTRLILSSARAGALRLGLLYVNNIAVAAQIWLVAAHKATIYKICYDSEWRDYSVGTLLTARMMRHVLDLDQVHEVDFGRDDEPHKKQWLSHRRELWGIAAFNPKTAWGMLGIARELQKRFVRKTRSRLKKILPKRQR